MLGVSRSNCVLVVWYGAAPLQNNFEMVMTFLKNSFALNDLELKPCERKSETQGSTNTYVVGSCIGDQRCAAEDGTNGWRQQRGPKVSLKMGLMVGGCIEDQSWVAINGTIGGCLHMFKDV
jgi:hypothetical protein